ncbi:hypothetical protein WA1_00230 [Scytonema hofmannii PCC 7110]|uniref:Uncharacterized protein n=1 Tax=Scytonema hofmannii PCC 7110 TaxID=128403 RepID=A0A139XG21_9CYAN|nr:hypothetical protein [Scytonema hofmannii]KYC43636.1 hypothetical protein WA1_00230 [Scytonema hofmannii PCC 7110]
MPDTLSSPVTPESSSPLIQRLDRRRTEPVSLVNSLRFQPSAMKIPQAIVQRSTLVQQLQSRYGIHTNEVAESELVLANPPSSEVSDNTLSTVASSIATMKQEGRRHKEVAEKASFDGFSTRRDAKANVHDERHFKEGGRWEDRQVGFKSQSDFHSTPSTAESTSSVTSTPGGQFRVSRKAIPKISQMDASTSIQAKLDTYNPVNSLVFTTNKIPSATAAIAELQPSQMSLKQQPPLVQIKAATTASLPLSPAELIQRSPASTSLPSVSQLPVVSELPSSSPRLQRANNEDVVDLGYIDFPPFGNSARANTQPANFAQENGYVSIQGIEANYARTNRGRENPPAALPLNTGSVSESISEVVPTVTAHQPLSTEMVVPVMPSKHPNSSIPEVDVAQVAEQVSRILFRQLRIERERRGFGR